MIWSGNIWVGFCLSVPNEAAMAYLTPGPYYRQMGFVGESPHEGGQGISSGGSALSCVLMG